MKCREGTPTLLLVILDLAMLGLDLDLAMVQEWLLRLPLEEMFPMAMELPMTMA